MYKIKHIPGEEQVSSMFFTQNGAVPAKTLRLLSQGYRLWCSLSGREVQKAGANCDTTDEWPASVSVMENNYYNLNTGRF
jgi:hypothetical protein